jgi:hypothetical protein
MSKGLGLGLGLALALAFAGPAPAEIVGPINTVFCNKTASVSVSSATTITLVSGISAATINWCGWHTTSTQSGSTTFQFEYGAAPGCANPTTRAAFQRDFLGAERRSSALRYGVAPDRCIALSCDYGLADRHIDRSLVLSILIPWGPRPATEGSESKWLRHTLAEAKLRATLA